MQKSDTTAAGPVLTDVRPFQKMLDFGLQAENVNRNDIIIQIKTALHLYCMSKKQLSILCSNLLYEMGKYFLDTQYVYKKSLRILVYFYIFWLHLVTFCLSFYIQWFHP